ncbi:WXG100 family type VII secretion target [Streptomyces sp. NPDC002403]
MDNSDGYIYVDYRHTENAADDMISQTQAIMSILANLDMEITELRNSWIGDDGEVYKQVQANWNAALENMKTLLSSHSSLLTGISDNYRYTEQNLAQRWGDIRIGSR